MAYASRLSRAKLVAIANRAAAPAKRSRAP
jgi:hypothetical protein